VVPGDYTIVVTNGAANSANVTVTV